MTDELTQQEAIEQADEEEVEEPEYVLATCKTCKDVTRHIVVGKSDKLHCCKCGRNRSNYQSGRLPKINNSSQDDTRGMTMEEFYERMTNTQLNQKEEI